MEEKPVLLVEDLQLSLGPEAAPLLRGLSFQLETGRTLGLVGPSGSGKSLTALGLMGLLPKAASLDAKQICLHLEKGSSVDLKGLDAKGWRKLRGREISMIFQEPASALNPVWSCGWQLAEMWRVHAGLGRKEARARSLALLAELGFEAPEKAFRAYPHQLSGGQQQRVLLAMAVACQPRLLICDEPTTGLDVITQQEILRLLQHWQAKTGMALLFISHDLGVMAEIADEVVWLENGRATAAVPTPQLLASRAQVKPLAKDLPSPASASLPLLRVENLEVRLTRPRRLWRKPVHTQAVAGVSFSLARGERLGLVGVSGSGKTTLAKAILGLVPTQAGRIQLAGALLQHPADWRAYRQKLQYVPQHPLEALNPRMSLEATLSEVLRQHRRELNPAQLLAEVGLSAAFLRRKPHELSGGEAQRACIARALAPQPQLLICDEPVAALDAFAQEKILALLRDLQQKLGLSLLFISHDLSLVSQLCTRACVMQAGKLVAVGSIDALQASPDPYTQALWAAVPQADPARAEARRQARLALREERG